MSIQILHASSFRKFSELEDQAQEEWSFSILVDPGLLEELIRYSGFPVTVCLYEARM